MNMDQVQDDVVRLRNRLLDLQKSLSFSPESYAIYKQTILQLHQETEKRRQSSFAQAVALKAQAAALESQGHAFSSMASILYSVVNGYVQLEEKRIEEERAREQERAEAAAPEPEPVTPARKKKSKKAAPEGSDTSGGDGTGNPID